MDTVTNTQHTRWSEKARRCVTAQPAVSVRVTLVEGARDHTQDLLRGDSVTGKTARQLKRWKETGGPLAELATWLHEHPSDLEPVVAYLRGAAMQEPAPFDAAMLAQAETDAAEDVAEIVALLERTPDALNEWARRAELSAARLIEAARAARLEAAQ